MSDSFINQQIEETLRGFDATDTEKGGYSLHSGQKLELLGCLETAVVCHRPASGLTPDRASTRHKAPGCSSQAPTVQRPRSHHSALLLLCLIFLTSIFCARSSFGFGTTISLNVGTNVSGNSLVVSATIASTFEIRDVKAIVEGRQANLLYGCVPSCAWWGTLSLSGLSRGSKTVVVTATDVFGNTEQTTAAFVYDLPPAVVVSIPLDSAVARPEIRVSAVCTDDDSAGCVSLNVFANASGNLCSPDPRRGPFPLLEARSGIDQFVSLAAFDGQNVRLTIAGKDSRGQCTFVNRTIPVESSPRLIETDRISSSGEITILDVSADRMLFIQNEVGIKTLKIRRRETGQESVIPIPDAVPVERGFLIPSGAIFETSITPSAIIGNNPNPARVYEWRSGPLVELASSPIAPSLVVKGGFAAWTVGYTGRLFLRDLSTGQINELGTGGSEGAYYVDVAANGDVVFTGETVSSSGDIYLVRQGAVTATKLTSNTSRRTDASSVTFYGPVTDGTNIVFTKRLNTLPAKQQSEILQYTSAGESSLASIRDGGTAPGRDYQVNNGWIAFTNPGTGGVQQVWTRSPSGTRRQVSFFGANSHVGSLTANGELTFVSNSRTYLATPGGVLPTDIASSLGQSVWLNEELFLAIGRTLFKVDSSPMSPPSISGITPSAAMQGTSLSVNIRGSFLAGVTAVAISGAGVTAGMPTNVGDSSITMPFVIAANATPSSRTVTVTNSVGTSQPFCCFTVVSSSTPNPPARPTTTPLPIPEVEQGNIRTGYVVITPDPNTSAPLATLTFGIVRNGIVQGQAGVVPSGVTTGAVLFVDLLNTAGRTLGLAIANPAGTTNAITITLKTADGSTVGTPGIINLDPYKQISKFVNELFASDIVGQSFVGSVTVQSGTPFALLGLRFAGLNFSSLSAGNTGTPSSVPPRVLQAGATLNAPAPGTIGGPTAILLPQFAMGGGWATQIALVNTGGATATGRIDIFDSSGQPLAVKLNGSLQSTFVYFIPAGGTFLLAPRDANGQSPM